MPSYSRHYFFLFFIHAYDDTVQQSPLLHSIKNKTRYEICASSVNSPLQLIPKKSNCYHTRVSLELKKQAEKSRTIMRVLCFEDGTNGPKTFALCTQILESSKISSPLFCNRVAHREDHFEKVLWRCLENFVANHSNCLQHLEQLSLVKMQAFIFNDKSKCTRATHRE